MATRYDLDGMLTTVTPLLRQRSRASLDLPVYDRGRRAAYRQSVTLSIDPDDVIVVEGVPARGAGRQRLGRSLARGDVALQGEALDPRNGGGLGDGCGLGDRRRGSSHLWLAV